MSTTPRVIRRATLDWVKYDAAIARDGSIDPVDKALYAALASFADSDYRETDPDPDSPDVPTRARLAQCIGRSVDTVDRAIRRLEERGIIRVTRRRDPDNPRRWMPSVYELLDHEWWDERAAERARARAEARAARGGRMDAARGSRMDAARGSRMDAAVNKEKRERKETSSSCSSSRPSSAPMPQAPRQEEEEEGIPQTDHHGAPGGPQRLSSESGFSGTRCDLRKQGTAPATATADHGEAAALVADLPTIAARAGRPLARALRADETNRLTALVAAALARGWTAEQIRAVLADDLRGARSLVATWHARLANLGNPPAPAAPAAPPKCDECNPFRWIEDDEGRPLERCPTCHPALAVRRLAA